MKREAYLAKRSHRVVFSIDANCRFGYCIVGK